MKAKGGEYEIRWAQVLVQVSSGFIHITIHLTRLTPPSYYQIRLSNRIFSAWCESWWCYRCVNSMPVWWMCDKASNFYRFVYWNGWSQNLWQENNNFTKNNLISSKTPKIVWISYVLKFCFANFRLFLPIFARLSRHFRYIVHPIHTHILYTEFRFIFVLWVIMVKIILHFLE